MKKYLVTLSLALLLVPAVAHIRAQTGCVADASKGEYCLLAPIPGIDQGDGKADIATYIPQAVKTIIGLATGLAVLLVIYGGVQYVISGAAGNKKDGKETIQNALLGLLLLSVSWILLYTLNPKLVQFSLSLDNVGSNNAIDTTLTKVSTTTPGDTGGTSNTGNTTGGNSTSGATAGTNNCGTSCAESQSFAFPQKAPGAACKGTTCYIDPALGKILSTINQNLGNTGADTDHYAWVVSEMTPPTVNHIDACHGNGTCVDASIIGLSSTPTNADALRIVMLFNQLDNMQGITYEYEACGPTLTALKNNIYLQQYAAKIKCESSTQNGSSGQSLHIEGPNASDKSFGHRSSGTF